MSGFLETITAGLDELREFSKRLTSLGPRDLCGATNLPGWSVEDLARHVGAVVWQQAEALHRARLRIAEPPSFVSIQDERPPLPEALDTAADHLGSAIARLDVSDDPLVPLPFATLPASVAAFVLLIEYGTHRYDLERALGDQTTLAPVVSRAVIDLLGAMLPMLAGEKPDRPVSYLLDAPGKPTTLEWSSDRWQTHHNGTVDCTVRGAESSVALFALGRITADDPLLTIDGDPALGARFKAYFPGP